MRQSSERATQRTQTSAIVAPAPQRRCASRALASLALLVAVTLVLWLQATPAAAVDGVDDWVHTWEVVRSVLMQPPTGPMVYYFGDSTARESTVSDASWTRQLSARAVKLGRRSDVRAYLLGGHNQTFAMDQTVLEGLPSTPAGQARGIVLIGVSLSRFIGPPTTRLPAEVAFPTPGVSELSPWTQHHYDSRRILSPALKRELVRRWMKRRWAGFKQYRSANLAAIEKLIDACKAKRLRPVLFELPLNLAVVGSGLDKPRSSYRTGCAALARKHDIAYLSLQPSLTLSSSGFYDICHLVHPGYTRWQARLSREVAELLPRP